MAWLCREAQRNAPSVLYLPSLERWGADAYASLREALVTAVSALPATCPVLVLATVQEPAARTRSHEADDDDDDEEEEVEPCPPELLRLFRPLHHDKSSSMQPLPAAAARWVRSPASQPPDRQQLCGCVRPVGLTDWRSRVRVRDG